MIQGEFDREMQVQDLIDALMKIQDKSKKLAINVPSSFQKGKNTLLYKAELGEKVDSDTVILYPLY